MSVIIIYIHFLLLILGHLELRKYHHAHEVELLGKDNIKHSLPALLLLCKDNEALSVCFHKKQIQNHSAHIS